MNTQTLQIIKALKQKEGSVFWKIGCVVGGNLRYFTVRDLTHILYEAVQDYIDHCDDPRAEMRRYFYMCTSGPTLLASQDDYYRLASFLTQIQVRQDGKFINGFDARFDHCLDNINFGDNEDE